MQVIGVVLLCACLLPQAMGAGEMYGISSQLKVGFIEIDVTNGSITPLGKALIGEAQAQNLAALDTERGIYYIIGLNLTTQAITLIGFNVKSGNIETNIKLPFYSSELVGVGEAVDVDPTNGEVFAVGLQADGQHHLYRINPRTGSTTYLAQCGYINVLGGAHAFDMTNNLVWLQYAVNDSGVVSLDLFAFDSTTGAQRHRVKEVDTKSLDTLTYDLYGNQLVGFGFDSATYQRTVLKLNGQIGAISLVGNVQGYTIDNGGIATMDSKARILYGQLQPPNNASAPFYLIGYNVDTTEVVSAVPLCEVSANCPWSMEFMPTKA